MPAQTISAKDYGLEYVEVSDDGSGIDPGNVETLAKKHYTSKIEQFEDLETVGTFGFRGEALSSLCAMSQLAVVTSCEDSGVGWELAYDANGNLRSKQPCAREQGTTVKIANLFHSLPVRLTELRKHKKREFSKLVAMLQGYCMVRPGVQFTLTHIQANSTRRLVLKTRGGDASTLDVITALFGSKTAKTLAEITCVPGPLPGIKVEGYVSKPMQTLGRSAPDRQFFFINKRPCEFTKLSRAVNEAYRGYNKNQYPFVVAHVTMQQQAVDVNVTPDKRTLFFHKEQALLETVKACITETLKAFEGTMLLKSPSSGNGLAAMHQQTLDFLGSLSQAQDEQATPAFSASAASAGSSSATAIAPSGELDAKRAKAHDGSSSYHNQKCEDNDDGGSQDNFQATPPTATVSTAAGGHDATPTAPASQALFSWECRVPGCPKFMKNLFAETNLLQHYRTQHPHRRVPGPRRLRSKPPAAVQGVGIVGLNTAVRGTGQQEGEQKLQAKDEGGAAMDATDVDGSQDLTLMSPSSTPSATAPALGNAQGAGSDSTQHQHQPHDNDNQESGGMCCSQGRSSQEAEEVGYGDLPMVLAQFERADAAGAYQSRPPERTVGATWQSRIHAYRNSIGRQRGDGSSGGANSKPRRGDAGGGSTSATHDDGDDDRTFKAAMTTDEAEKELSTQLTKGDFQHMEVLGQFNHGFIIPRPEAARSTSSLPIPPPSIITATADSIFKIAIALLVVVNVLANSF